ncbi:MAG: DUF6691 family protein [Nitrosomonadales bacterium]
MTNIIALVTGLIFGFGLAISGMTHTEIVLGFLDVAGQWNPSLLFVLGGAVIVTVASFHFIGKLPKPVLAERFWVTDAHEIDRSLVIGSVLFGIGWGISGYCPGPAIALLAAPNWELWVFLPSMLVGAGIHWLIRGRPAQKEGAVAPNNPQVDQPTCG